MHIIKSLLIFSCLGLSGCSRIIAEYISSQQSFGYEHIASRDELIKQGFSKSRYCLKQKHSCISYLRAEPLADKQQLNYTVTIDASGHEETIQLKLNRNNASSYHGEVVLIHGFRTSKEFMINSALYFRFLGFSVVIPDLLGHGESDGEISFGVKDSQILNELLSHRSKKNHPLLVAGNSMGAVAATHLAAKNITISGLILQAPMIKFDSAALNYINSYSPWLASLLPDQSIREAAIRALNSANVSLSETDIKPMLASLTIPILILASDGDPVAPFAYYHEFQKQGLTVFNTENRSHPGMAVIGQEDNKQIQLWLNSQTITMVKKLNN